jgi:hemoglobin/transferrin/lactoferrin receptor protein
MLVAAQGAYAQSASSVPLDPLTVEAKAAKKKKAAQAKAPPQSTPEPVPQPEQKPVSPEQARQDAPFKTPAAVSSVSTSDLRTFGQVDTGDVIRSIPGTFTRESPSNPGIAVNIRGFEGSGRVNTMIDGVRQSFRFTGHEAQGFAYIDPALLAGIDVQRGAVSTAGGAGALAGTANLRTLGIDDIIKPGQNMGALTSVTWGSNGVGWSEMAAAGVRNGAIGFAGAISKKDQDNFENGDGIVVPFTSQDLRSGLFKGEVKLSSEQKVNFGGVLYDNDFVANSYDQTLNSKTFTLNYAYDPVSTDLVHLRINGYRNEVEMKYGDSVTASSSAAGRVIQDDGTGFDISNTSKFALGAVGVKSTYGYEYFKDDVDTFNRLNPSNGGGVNPSGKSEISGAFSETTFSYGMFDLIGGLRYDTYKLEGSFPTPVINPLGVPLGSNTLDQDEGRLNPAVTLAAQVLPWLQPYAKYAEAFRAPDISETMLGGSHPGGTFSFAPNPFLKPEVQKGWEFGANVVVDGLLVGRDRFRLKADYFTQDVDDYIVGQIANTMFGPFFFYNNVEGTSQVDGVEVEANYDSGFVFAGISYTYTNTNLPSQINGLGAQSYLPDQILTLTGGFRLLQERLTVGARGTFASQAYNGADQVPFNANGDPSDPFSDGYALLDLYTNYKLDSGLELGANLTNVFDVAYTPALSTPATNFSGDTGRGRTVLFTARAQF